MATKFYFTNTLSSLRPIITGSSWIFDTSISDGMYQTQYAKLNLAPTNSGINNVEEFTTDIYDVLFRSYISNPLSGSQTISGTVDMQMIAGADNPVGSRSKLEIYVVSNDCKLIRGILLPDGIYGLDTDLANQPPRRNHTFASATALSSVLASNGDRIIINVGTHGSSNMDLQFSDQLSDTDLPVDEIATTGRPWVQFSANIAIGEEAPINNVLATPYVVSSNAWSSDVIELKFSDPMLRDTQLTKTSNYTITPVTIGNSVTVLGVRAGKSTSAPSVFLNITQPTVGATYRISASTNLVGLNGIYLSANISTCIFVARQTKIDDMLNSLPKHYDIGIDSRLRNILMAIGRQDDLLGGTRLDFVADNTAPYSPSNSMSWFEQPSTPVTLKTPYARGNKSQGMPWAPFYTNRVI